MIILDMEQGTPEWLAARCGVPTASNFDKLIASTGKPSTQADAYANKLIAEMITGESADADLSNNQWVMRGNELEPDARRFYEMQRDSDVQQVGFVLRDDRRVGCSPDGLVGDDGLVEIKCPSPAVHVQYLLGGKLPSGYKAQVQGQMLIAERGWCDFISYHPLMPPALFRVERDDKFIAALEGELTNLLGLIDERLNLLAQQGILTIKEAA